MIRLITPFAFFLLSLAADVQAGFVVGSFGPNGEGGELKGQTLTFGPTGSIFELDGSVAFTGGPDPDDPPPGDTRRLSSGSPNGLGYTFGQRLFPDRSSLLLSYHFSNETDAPLANFQFLVFVDAEINSAISTADEFGEVLGTLGIGATDPSPDSWEIDEPGYAFGDIFTHLLSGNLDNTNAIPSSSPEDISFALGFQVGTLNPGGTAIIEILLSDNGTSIGSFALRHADPTSPDTLTLSGQATVTAVPEPSSMIPLGTGLFALAGYTWNRRRRSAR